PASVTGRERARLACDLHSNARTAGRFDAQYANRLEITTTVPGRLDAPAAQVLLDVRGGESDARTVGGAALKLIGGHIREPLLQILALDDPDTAGVGVARMGRTERRRTACGGDGPGRRDDERQGPPAHA